MHKDGISETVIFGFVLAFVGLAVQLSPLKWQRVAQLLSAACWIAAGELLLIHFLPSGVRVAICIGAGALAGAVAIFAVLRPRPTPEAPTVDPRQTAEPAGPPRRSGVVIADDSSDIRVTDSRAYGADSV